MAYKLSIGIVGLPNVGKSTLFKRITSQEVHIANYPFATIDPNVGVVTVPDERLAKMTALSKSKKTIPAVVEFYDIAGLVKGASEGQGLGNQFLSHIRDTQAIVVVLRLFENPEIIHVEGAPDALRDLEIINTELMLKDLDVVEKRIGKLEGEARTGEKTVKANLEIFERLAADLKAGKLALPYRDEPAVRELQLLTAKKQLYLLNGEERIANESLKAKIRELGADYLTVNLADRGADAIESLIRKAYAILGLVSFFTTGEDETRAWTIVRGEKAPQAAGEIHTDFEKNFIRAEVLAADKFFEAGGWNQAKQKGWVRLEGKEYIVQDGDIMIVRHG